MIEEPVLALDDIQGDIIPGFKKDSQHFLFFRIVDPVLAKRWLHGLAPRLSTATEVLAAHALWKQMRCRLGRDPDTLDYLLLNCAISAQGLRMLGVPDVDLFDDIAFKLGLEARATSIGDPPKGSGLPGAPETWLFGSGDRRPDVLLILAADDLDWVLSAEQTLIAEAQQQGLEWIHGDRGRVRPGAMAGHEHFGFKDGISQPAIRGRKGEGAEDYLEPRIWPADPAFDPERSRFAAPGRPLVWPGHFLFGYPRQLRDNPETPRSNSHPVGPDWSTNGSFLTYRRLNQDVLKFRDFIEATTEVFRHNGFDPNLTPERMGALFVGRWASGWPIARDPLTDRGSSAGENYFRFVEATTVPLPDDPLPLNVADPGGQICPFAAHIRKVNPRDDDTDLGPKERTFQKYIIRRGITFGPEVDEQPEAERGLIFAAFQSSIVDQFEFLMNDWVNDADKPHSNSGVDPILSTRTNTTIQLVRDNQPFPCPVSGGWITASGGEYFFAPSILFFARTLA
ncbi:Dyp-type peroxidase [Synechococcus sp. BO 8801]|uniref:Dyp-type peroxidase n=1 Tax=Synechococcus sp. BO 8801 TaxID=169670 RepID=UPI000B98FDBE|nr:Dyp-type peroxidase [Synechococcus sp. BO 8801]